MLFACTWKRHFQRGPLEWVMRRFSTLSMDIAAPATLPTPHRVQIKEKAGTGFPKSGEPALFKKGS
jgi:hypothetical protein